MTIDLLEDLEALTPKLTGAIETVRLDEAARRALDQLKAVRGQAERFSAAVEIVGLLDQQCEPRVRTALLKAKTRASDVGEALQEATDASGVQDAANTYTEGFATELLSLDGAVRDAWRNVVFRDYEPLRVMGALLDKIEGTRSLGAALLAAGEEARALTDARPPLPDLKAAIAGLQLRAASLREELCHVGQDDPDIDAFLRALAANQATVRHLRPAVLAWLETNHALDIFSVGAN
jgi:hypothetical protein